MEFLSWNTILAVYLIVAVFIFGVAIMYHYLVSEYVPDKNDWISWTSLSIFWPIYLCRKIIDVILAIFKFLFEVITNLVDDIFRR